MYLWNVKALSDDLRDGKVTQHEQMKYLLTFILLYISPSFFGGREPSAFEYDAIFAATNLVIFMIGTYLCYRTNRSGDNRDFILRYICLLIPTTIRFLVICIPVILLSSAFFGSVKVVPTAGFVILVLSIVMNIIYFAYLRSLFRKLAAPIPATTVVPPADA